MRKQKNGRQKIVRSKRHSVDEAVIPTLSPQLFIRRGLSGRVPSLEDPRALLILIHDAIAHLIGPLTKIAATGSDLERIAKALERPTESRLHGMAITDKRGLLLNVSSSVATVFGFDWQSVKGKRGCQFLHPESIQEVRQMIKVALRQLGPAPIAQARCRDTNGNWHAIKLTVGRLAGRGETLLLFTWVIVE